MGAPETPSCTVAGGAPVVQYANAMSVAGTETLHFYVSEYDAAGDLLASVDISVPGPFTLGAVVTAEGAVNAAMASCQVTGIAMHGNWP
jgi:hypothetical protein